MQGGKREAVSPEQIKLDAGKIERSINFATICITALAARDEDERNLHMFCRHPKNSNIKSFRFSGQRPSSVEICRLGRGLSPILLPAPSAAHVAVTLTLTGWAACPSPLLCPSCRA
eukprot:6206776-Pleurochrysis_carterae.AAC.1